MREHYIDNIKAFSILLIITGHSGIARVFPAFYVWLFSFHVPIFFFISGYMMERNMDFGNLKVAKSFGSYMIPYFVFSVLYQILIEFLNIVAGNRTFVQAVQIMLQSIVSFDGGDTANWFLFTLFVAEILYRVERKYLKPNTVFWVNIVLLLLPITISHNNEYIRGILRTFPAIFFLSSGGQYYRIRERIESFIKSKYLLFVLVAAAQIVLSILNGRVDTYGLSFGRISLLYFADALMAIGVIYYIAYNWFNRRIPVITWYGKNTLIVMATHQAVIELMYVIDMHTLNILERYGGAPVLLSIMVVIIEIPIIIMINQWFYWMLGRNHPIQDKLL